MRPTQELLDLLNNHGRLAHDTEESVEDHTEYVVFYSFTKEDGTTGTSKASVTGSKNRQIKNFEDIQELERSIGAGRSGIKDVNIYNILKLPF